MEWADKRLLPKYTLLRAVTSRMSKAWPLGDRHEGISKVEYVFEGAADGHKDWTLVNRWCSEKRDWEEHFRG